MKSDETRIRQGVREIAGWARGEGRGGWQIAVGSGQETGRGTGLSADDAEGRRSRQARVKIAEFLPSIRKRPRLRIRGRTSETIPGRGEALPTLSAGRGNSSVEAGTSGSGSVSRRLVAAGLPEGNPGIAVCSPLRIGPGCIAVGFPRDHGVTKLIVDIDGTA